MPVFRTSKNPSEEASVKKIGVALTGGDIEDFLTISGGGIVCFGIWVQLTEAVSAHAALIHFESDPTVGASNTQISEGTAAPDIQSGAIGDIFALDGDSQDVMVKYANGTDLPQMANNNGGIFIPDGGIDLKLTTNNPTTGIANIYLLYKPAAPGAMVS